MSQLAKLVRSEPFLLSVSAVVLGFAAAYGSGSEPLFSVARDLTWWHVLPAPTLGGLVIGWFVYFVMPERRNRGVAGDAGGGY